MKSREFNTFSDLDIVDLFLNDVYDVALLTAEEEIQLAKQIELGKLAKEKLILKNLSNDQKKSAIQQIESGRDAANLLVIANSRLVISVAKKYCWTGMSLMDLIQEGHIGLINAIDKYNYKLGFRFSTYAKWWIWQAISKAISSSGRTIRLPPHLLEDVRRLEKLKSILILELGRNPTIDEICESMCISRKRVENIIKVSQPIQSLDAPINSTNQTELGDFIADDDFSPEERILSSQLRTMLEQGISILNPKESAVIKLIYGIGNDRPLSAIETAETMKITRERVRQIHLQAITKLRLWVNYIGTENFI